MNLADDIGNAFIDFSDGVRAKIITEKKVESWQDRQTEKAKKAVAQNVLAAFEANVITDKFSPARIRDWVQALRIRKVDADTDRGRYRIGLSNYYQTYIESLHLSCRTAS
jgi:hypothetical protein